MTDMKAFVRRIGIPPDLTTRPRIDRPDVVGCGDVNHAVGEDRRRFDLLWLVRLKGPRERELTHVRRRDLRQRAMTLSGVVTVIGGPAVACWLQQRGRLERLRDRGDTTREDEGRVNAESADTR